MSLTGLARAVTKRRPARPAKKPRAIVASATETIALVLDADTSVLEGAQDVHDLVLRFRDHLTQLEPAARRKPHALATAQRLASMTVSADLLQGRAHLRHLATALRTLIAELDAASLLSIHDPEGPSALDVGRPAPPACVELGVIESNDTGRLGLGPDGVIVSPHGPLPLMGRAPDTDRLPQASEQLPGPLLCARNALPKRAR